MALVPMEQAMQWKEGQMGGGGGHIEEMLQRLLDVEELNQPMGTMDRIRRIEKQHKKIEESNIDAEIKARILQGLENQKNKLLQRIRDSEEVGKPAADVQPPPPHRPEPVVAPPSLPQPASPPAPSAPVATETPLSAPVTTPAAKKEDWVPPTPPSSTPSLDQRYAAIQSKIRESQEKLEELQKKRKIKKARKLSYNENFDQEQTGSGIPWKKLRFKRLKK